MASSTVPSDIGTSTSYSTATWFRRGGSDHARAAARPTAAAVLLSGWGLSGRAPVALGPPGWPVWLRGRVMLCWRIMPSFSATTTQPAGTGSA